MSRRDGFADGHPRAVKLLSRLRACLPPLNFITLHYAYFVAVCLIASLIFWGSSDPAFSISYTDSLFVVVSAMTETGLNTVNLSQMTTWQQVLLCFLIILGSAIWVSIWTVVARKHAFEKRFEDIVRADRIRKRSRTRYSTSSHLSLLRRFGLFRKARNTPVDQAALTPSSPESRGRSELPLEVDGPTSQSPEPSDILRQAATPTSQSDHITFVNSPRLDAGAHGLATSSSYLAEHQPTRRSNPTKASSDPEKHHANIQDFLSNRSVGRNGQFHDLTSEEREYLGGYEYRALKLLAIVVPLYSFLWQFLGCVALGAWINNNLPEPAISNGINPWWLGIFNGFSAFNNCGMSLLDANMVPYQNSYFVLITMGLMILAGNTAYPVFLRLIFWSLFKALTWTTADDDLCDLKETLKFILKYPRRVYTNLFPSRPTWWLVFMLVCLNSVDWVAFELLNLGNPAIDNIPTGSRILDGLFQGLAVRSGGFYVVPISSVYIGLQVLYVIMMYISVYPVVITMRHSNVYEERSLGIYVGDEAPPQDDPEEATALLRHPSSPVSGVAASTHRASRSGTSAELGRALRHSFATFFGVGVTAQPPPPFGEGPESPIGFVSQQVQGQLAHDIWWLVIAVLVITTIETGHFLADPVAFSVFNIIFEVVSAFGCVGISVGLPAESYSFSGGWRRGSKLVLCLVMIRGRHRGLPVALDGAVRLPGEQLHRDEEEDHRIRRSLTSRGVGAET